MMTPSNSTPQEAKLAFRNDHLGTLGIRGLKINQQASKTNKEQLLARPPPAAADPLLPRRFFYWFSKLFD